MRLTHLILRNIGPFRDPPPISLETDKSATGYAFFADNGRGKTSIYNAMRWCLFGEVRGRATTVKGKRIEGSLRPIVGDGKILMNKDAYEQDKVQEMSVMLIAQGQKGQIQVQRTAKSMTTLPRTDEELSIEITVTIGGNTTSGKKAQEAIETFFPKGLERFFFIDGEALEEYTEMMQSSSLDGLQEDVNAVLRIPALTKGEDDLVHIRQGIKAKITSSNKVEQESSLNRDRAKTLQRELDSALSKVTSTEKSLVTLRSKLLNTNEQLKSHQEYIEVYKQMDVLDIQIGMLEAELSEAAHEKMLESKEAWKELLWQKAGPLYKTFNDQIDEINNREAITRSLEKDIERDQSELKTMDGICSKCEQPIKDIIIHQKKLSKDIEDKQHQLLTIREGSGLSSEHLYSALGDLQKMMPPQGTKERILRAEKKWKDRKRRLQNNKEEFNTLNAKVTDEGKADTDALRETKGRQETLIASREKELKLAKSVASNMEVELRKFNRLAGKGSEDTEIHSMDVTISKLIVAIKDTIASYRETARKSVEENASSVFLELTNAKGVFSGINLDKNFKANIKLSKGGFAVNPSSGMVSMMTISVIDALRRVSGIDAPVFLDTPGRSLDFKHKEELLNYFWKNEGHQFLIFAHSGEFDTDNTLDAHSEQLAKAWSLSWPGDHRNCYVCESENVEYNPESKMNTCSKCGEKWDIRSNHTMIRELKF